MVAAFRSDTDTDALMLMGLAAHQLQSPLRNMRVLIDLCRDHPPGAAPDEALMQTVADMAARAEQDIRDVLTYCRDTAEPPVTEELAVADCVAELGRVLDPDGIAFITAPDLQVVTDVTAFSLVLRSLLQRCLEPLRPRLKVAVTLAQGEGEGGVLSVRLVSSDAAPLSPSECGHLDTGHVGSGISFALIATRHLLARHGGTLTYDVPGQGLELEFSLPGRILSEKA